jgi:peptidoglycan/xylan/chitin deacetylase (PgdA/CDA1 family)
MTSSVTSLRWYLKKTARAGMVFTSWGSGYLALSAATAAGPRLRVLTYHRFGNLPRDPFCVSVPDFAAQMAFLAEHRLAVGVAELESFLAGRAPVPDGAVLVTIDDGFRSTLTDAMPVLRDHGVPAIAFITPTKLGRAPGDGGEDDDLPEPFMTWDELDRLAAGGVTIGSHAWTHRSLGRMPPAEAEDEAVRSREALERHLGRPVTTFAYPFGTRADYSETTAAILARAGYGLAFTSQHGPIRPGMDPHTLPRVKIEGGEGLRPFRLATRGGLDNWRLIDQTLWRIQVAGRG